MKDRGKFELGRTSNERRREVSGYLNMTANRAIRCSPIDFGVPMDGGKRTDERQNAIFLKGFSRCDGYEDKSFHQQVDENGLGKALDLVPYIKGVGLCYDAPGRAGIIGMLMLEAWEELQEEGIIPRSLHLHWGGLWKNSDPKKLGWDLAHFEIRTYSQIERL